MKEHTPRATMTSIARFLLGQMEEFFGCSTASFFCHWVCCASKGADGLDGTEERWRWWRRSRRHKHRHEVRRSQRCMFEWRHGRDSLHANTGAATLLMKQVKTTKNYKSDASDSPLLHLLHPSLKAKVKNDAVFKDGD